MVLTKDEKNPRLLNQQLRRIPKVDLHRHLDCCLRWSTLIELAPQVGIEVPKSHSARQDAFLVLDPMRNLESVLRKFLNSQKVLASDEILTRLAFEACEDAFNDNILVAEFRYAPSFISEGHGFNSYEKIHKALTKGIQAAEKKFPMAVGLVCILQRSRDLKTNDHICNFAIDHKESFIGLDIADLDINFDESTLITMFQKARNAGLRITAHAGESPWHGAIAQIRKCIDQLGAERIGHGVQVIQDPQMMNYLLEKKITLEVCPISNALTQAFPNYEFHPLRKLYAAGLRVTINSDDPGIFGTTLSDEYEVAHLIHGFSLSDFQRVNQFALEASFIPPEKIKLAWRL